MRLPLRENVLIVASSMKPMVFDSGEVAIYGKLVTVLRRL